MKFFIYFLWRVGLERNGMIIFIFPVSRSIPTYYVLKWATMIFLNFPNFYSIFFEFSITRRVITKRNDNFCFLSFSAISNLFWLQMKTKRNFFNFFLFFWNFLLCVRLERNRTIVFIFSISRRFPPYFGFKWSHNSIL